MKSCLPIGQETGHPEAPIGRGKHKLKYDCNDDYDTAVSSGTQGQLLLVSSSSIQFLKFTASISETQIDDNRCRNIMEVNNGRISIIFCYIGNRSIGATENVRVRMLENSVNHRPGNLWHRERTSYSAHESDVTRGYYPLAALERPVRSLSENFERRRFENFVENECCLLTHKHQFGTNFITDFGLTTLLRTPRLETLENGHTKIPLSLRS
ncbi:hypothetical protein TNCV_3759491 [Trichonephila clavipes]|nr:hypothetical protein TNCV_3759491 [Trichonephila clavipes]